MERINLHACILPLRQKLAVMTPAHFFLAKHFLVYEFSFFSHTPLSFPSSPQNVWPGSATDLLYHLGQIALPFCASVFPLTK